MKVSLLPLQFGLFLLILVGCNPQPAEVEPTPEPKKSEFQPLKIRKQVSRTEDKEKFENDEPEYVYYEITYFDTAGKVMERLNFDKDSVLSTHFVSEWSNDSLVTTLWSRESMRDTTLHIEHQRVFFQEKEVRSYLLRSWRYQSFDDGTETKTPLPHKSTYRYDKEGRLIASVTLYDGQLTERQYQYDSLGNKVGFAQYLQPGDSLNYKEEYVYDSLLRKVMKRETSYVQDSAYTSFRRYYRYNQQDSLTSVSHYNSNGQCFLKEVYTRNVTGQKVLETVYNDLTNGDSTLLSGTTEYSYYPNGFLKEKSMYNSEEELFSTSRYTYNANQDIERIYTINFFITLDKHMAVHEQKKYFEYEYY